MILKKEGKKKKKYNLNKFLFIYFFSTITVGIVLIIFTFKSQTFEQAKSKYLDLFSKGGRFEFLYLPNITFQAIKSNFSKLEKLDLEIKFNDSLILENVRNEAIKNGTLPATEYNTLVNFNLIHNNTKYSGDIRLKGDRKAHFFEKEHSSYKIKLDKENYIFGLSKFSLQKPRIRNYIHEWIFHQMAKDFDIIKIKYEFLDLSINGENKGLYVLEEGFGKELIERNKRRNGPIFGFDEDLRVDEEDLIFEIYNKKYWSKKENIALAKTASQKLRDFFKKKVPLENVFDVERWAAYFAVVDMTSTYHGAFLKSVKFYYNPINGLFEPIPYDGHRLKPNYHKQHLNYDNNILIDIVELSFTEKNKKGWKWLQNFFYNRDGSLNSSFYNLYLKKLNQISSKKYLDKFLSENLKKIKIINSHIYSDYFYYDNSRTYGVGLYYFLLSDFFYHANNIKKKLKLKKQIQVIRNNESEFLVKNYYKNYGALSVDKLICNKNEKKVEIKITKILNNFSNTVIKLPEIQSNNLECTHMKFIEKFDKNSFVLKIDDINSKYRYKSFKNLTTSTLDKYFIKQNDKLFLIKDEIEIDENLHITKGFNVIVKPGQKILLINNAFVISESPWTIGGKNKETTITGKKNNLGGGLLILDNNKLSKIQNTNFSFLNGYNIDSSSEYIIYGALNFHQTKVEINNVNFKNITSEDALNIFRSKFKISNSNYENISSDAIDIDFSDGDISSVNFKNINNDAMDFSGSNVNIYNSYLENVNDKLISGGEASNIKISKITAKNSKSGIISKDGSKVYSKNILFDGVKIPFAAYQKKKEYNYGLLVVENFDVDNFLVKFAKDEKSNIILNDVIQKNNNGNAKILAMINQ